MAEERILIEQENDHCAKCQSYPNCDNCDYWFKSMTRQEAIKRMARAICSHRVGECPETEYHCDNCWADSSACLAEAALNALLSEV